MNGQRASLERATSGLINPTWFVRARDGRELVLQRVNPIFPPEVNVDIEAVTRHLSAKGIETPTLVPSRFGKLWLEHGGDVWRVLTRIDGTTRDALESPAQAREAGRVLAEFHTDPPYGVRVEPRSNNACHRGATGATRSTSNAVTAISRRCGRWRSKC